RRRPPGLQGPPQRPESNRKADSQLVKQVILASLLALFTPDAVSTAPVLSFALRFHTGHTFCRSGVIFRAAFSHRTRILPLRCYFSRCDFTPNTQNRYSVLFFFGIFHTYR
ncbi:MAG: hypothetical protein J5872_00415, partial [Lachnospiraceae bacterium]|nr:hypothetical protein [Lachnospiraceae bacterium]